MLRKTVGESNSMVRPASGDGRDGTNHRTGAAGEYSRRGVASRRRLPLPVLVVALAALLAVVGCTRRFYRQQADKDVDRILSEKDVGPWTIEQYHIYPDPRARFYDPTDPDHPPMPPDDPGARDLSPNPQKPGKAGVGMVEGIGYLQLLREWDAANRAAEAAESQESAKGSAQKGAEKLPAPTPSGGDSKTPPAPAAPEAKPPECLDASLHPSRPYRITLDQCVELGGFNSREFQDRREDLYLTALPVTTERFSFAAQFLVAGEAIREWSGAHSPQGLHNRWAFTGNTGVSQLFPTGALLLLNFANQTVVDFNRFPKTTSQSTASLDLIQPLLRGGGQAVTLEPLTQSERDLLYEVRQYARFRKEYYVSIAGGGGGSISGGTFQPTGVVITSDFSPGAGIGGSGLFPGNIQNPQLVGVSPQVTPGQSGRLNLNRAITATPSGYLGTLLQYSQIAIDQENIEALERFLKLFRAFKEGGDISQLQVDQVEQQLLQGRSAKLQDEQQYGTAIDQFRVQLGLPTDLPLELDDAQLRPLTQQFRRYEQVFRQQEETLLAVEKLSTAPAGQLRAALLRLNSDSPLTRGTKFQQRFPTTWAEWQRLTDDQATARIRRARDERRKLLDRHADLEQKGEAIPEAEQLRVAELEVEDTFGSFELALRDYEKQPWLTEADEKRRRQVQGTSFRTVINYFNLLLGEARNERLIALRSTWPELPNLLVEKTDLLAVDEEAAFGVASQTTLSNRLDLMNARAQLVDAWRQLAVFGNALLGTLNVQYHMSSTSPAGQARPLALGASRYDHQLILNTQLPLVRVAERNNYRASLIAFQRQRRAMMEAEDLAVEVVRGEVRQLRVLAENYRIQQRQVELAYLTVENSLDVFQQPPGASGAAVGAQGTAAQAASLTQQLLNAQRNLPSAQNSLLTAWVNYVNTRMQLYRDLELISLDDRGVWLDDTATSRSADACRAGDQRPGSPVPPAGSPGKKTLE